MTGRRAATALIFLALSTWLSGCSGGDDHALGDVVEVEFHDADSQPVGNGTVAVTDVRKGSTAELEEAGYNLDDEQRSATVFFVDLVVDNAGDGSVSPGSPGGEDPDGNLLPALTVIDLGDGQQPFEPCPGVPEEVAAGQEAEGCSIVLVPDGIELERVYFHPGGAEDFVYWKTG